MFFVVDLDSISSNLILFCLMTHLTQSLFFSFLLNFYEMSVFVTAILLLNITCRQHYLTLR